jgi:DNA-binding CsgD family transcriptional regulator
MTLVGRAAESSTVERMLAGAREGRSAVLIVRGEAGVGKSALLEAGLEQADDFMVLRGVGVEVESELAYAALHQILRPVFDRIDRLPEPQAAALRAAFGLSSETVGERFLVSVGVLGLLSEAAEERPLVCIVDDAQWLDRPSADALLFTARRLEAEPIAVFFGVRDGDERPFSSRGLPELRLERLSATDSRTLVAERLGPSVAPDVVEWVVDNANGNPLALLELPSTLTAQQLAGLDPLATKLAPTTTVEQLYLDRVKELPPATQSLLVVAAAEESGARATIQRACHELGLESSELAAAEAAGLIQVDADRLVFKHPLVRSAVYRSAAFTEREDAHRVLAVASTAERNPDRAAWHRAAATVGTDEAIARELERTAERARLRSGHAAAASALERAAELSDDEAAQARRLVAAATAAWHAGQPERATGLLDRAAPVARDPHLRADLDHVRGVIEWRCGSLPDASRTLLAGAAKIAPLAPEKAVEMLADAGIAAWDTGDYERFAEAGEQAAALPRSGDDEHALLAEVLAGAVRMSLGTPPADLPHALAAIDRARELTEPRLLTWAAIAAELAGDGALESELLGRAAALARASGAVDRLTVALESATIQGFLAGRHTVATEATEGLMLAREAGLPNAASLHLAALAWLAAVQGRDDECRARAAEARKIAHPNGHGLANSVAEWALALLDLGVGRPEEAAERLVSLSAAPPGVAHPFYVLSSAPDLVEAAIRAGNREAAESASATLERFATPGAPTWARALAARCRGLLQHGEPAERDLAHALELHGNPFDRARTELLYGELLRRSRRRAEARTHLRAALDAFERLRAEPWAERVRTELRASGESARKRDSSGIEQLTPQELQIARLVAEGHSNKEVAAQLFLSPRTVEYHLRKVFAKLGVTSRSELVRLGIDADREPAAVS